MRKPSWHVFLGLVVMCVAGAISAAAQKEKPPEHGKGVLEVVVTDDTGERLAGAAVAVPGYRSTTGLNGTCRFGLLPGRYSILVSKAGYHPRRVTAGVRPDDTITTEVRLQKVAPPRPPKK